MKRLLTILQIALLPALLLAAVATIPEGLPQVHAADTTTPACSGSVTYPTINASQDDYTRPGASGVVETSCVIRMVASGAVDITGIGWQAPSVIRYLVNASAAGKTITLKSASSNSTAKYQFALAGDIALGSGDAVVISYDWENQRWRVLGSTTPGTITGDISGAGATFTSVTSSGVISTTGTVVNSTANGASWTRQSASESITLSTSGATTDSSANLLPANSIIKAVVCRVTTTITTATDWGISDPTTTLRFSAADSTMTSGETIVGLKHMFGVVSTTATGPTQASAAKLRITTTGTPGAGVVRCTVFSEVFVAPTS